MIEILRNATFRRLFLAQVVALAGTGLATVALALLAYELAGDRAGAVLGTALAIKMTAYVLLAPLSTALVPAAKRKAVLIALDLLRAGVALALPFVTEVWQVRSVRAAAAPEHLDIRQQQPVSCCRMPIKGRAGGSWPTPSIRLSEPDQRSG